MKILSSIINLFKKESVCAIPELNFESKNVKRGQREVIESKRENENIINDFANAYLERVRGIMRWEKCKKVSNENMHEFPRRALKCEESTKIFDELDVMISNLTTLKGLNVAERVNSNKRI